MLIDSHCHLDDDRFDTDREHMMARARVAGVRQFVIPATTRQRWEKIRMIAGQFEGAYPAYGLHPMFMREHQSGDAQALDAWLDDNEAVAVGECGLDFYQSNDAEKEQLHLLRAQLDIATNHHLPVILHVRKALDQVLRELRQSAVRCGVVHSFSGSAQQARQLVDLGFRLGIAATVSFERASKLRQVVSEIEVSALLIETDAPDQPGSSHRGERNEPAFIVDHLKTIAQLRDQREDELARQLNLNARALFPGLV